MNQEITDIKLSFKCPVNYNEMQAVPGGRFCNECQKIVHDFTDAKAEYFWQVVAESAGEGICGRFKPAQLTPEKPSRPWIKWLSAAAMVLGISLPWHKAQAQNTDSGKSKESKTKETVITLGMIKPYDYAASFAGGVEKFKEFVYHHARLSKKISEPVVVSLIISADGKPTIAHFYSVIDSSVVNELKRVVAMSPDWKPAQKSGKNVKSSTVFRLNF